MKVIYNLNNINTTKTLLMKRHDIEWSEFWISESADFIPIAWEKKVKSPFTHFIIYFTTRPHIYCYIIRHPAGSEQYS